LTARSRKKTYGIEDLRHEARSGEFAPVYAVLGAETLLAEEALELLATCVPPESRDFNANLYSGDDENARSFLAQARSFPFMTERRLVVVRRFDKMSFREPRAEGALMEYLQQPSPTTVLVLAAEKLDRRLKVTQSVLKCARVVVVEELSERELPSWVRGRFAMHGLEVDAKACAHLVQLVGDSLLDLRNEVDKVAARFADAGRVGKEEVSETVGHYRQEEVWAIHRAFRADNMSGFMQALARVLEADDQPIRVTALMARQVSNLMRVKLLHDRGTRGPDLARQLGLPPFAVHDLATQAMTFSRQQLALWLRNLQRADVQMKSLRLPQRWVLERALMNSFLGQDLA
jgi:DNA polymerase-3 subunit delta